MWSRLVGAGAAVGAALVPSVQLSCAPPVCTPPAGVPLGARQVVVVTTSGSRAEVDLLVDDGSGWRCAATGLDGRVGHNGIRPLAQRRSRDGTTPSGTCGVGTMTASDGQTFQFFGNGSNPGVPSGTWRPGQVR